MGKSWPIVEVGPGDPPKGGGKPKFYFHKKSRNGQCTSDSQGYSRKYDAKKRAEKEYPGIPIIEVEHI